MRLSLGLLRAGGLFATLSGGLQAEYLYPWSAAPAVTDENDAGISDQQDILAAWHAFDGTYHYFRVDLEAAPTSVNGGAAEIYGIYIHSRPGGGSNADVQYIPAGVGDVEYILDTHVRQDTPGYQRHDYHVWSPYLRVFNFTTPDATQQTENGGRTLEWKVANLRLVNGNPELIGTSFTWTAADLTQGSPSTTHDLAESVYFPEPGTALLGVLALSWAVSRRRA